MRRRHECFPECDASQIQRYAKITPHEREQYSRAVEETTDAERSAAYPTPDDGLAGVAEEVRDLLTLQESKQQELTEFDSECGPTGAAVGVYARWAKGAAGRAGGAGDGGGLAGNVTMAATSAAAVAAVPGNGSESGGGEGSASKATSTATPAEAAAVAVAGASVTTAASAASRDGR